MSERLTLGAAARSLRRLAAAAGGATTRGRIELLAARAEDAPDDLELNLGDVVGALYPADERGVVRFRELREALRKLAARESVELACEVDGQKRAAPHARRCWFTGADDEVQRIEQLSLDASQSPSGPAPVPVRGRREILRICIDEPATRTRAVEDLADRLTRALKVNAKLDVQLTSTRALAGENTADVRARRLADADLVVCLLNHAYLEDHGDSASEPGRTIVPVAVEMLGDADLGSLGDPFAHDGKPYDECGRKAQFVNALVAQIVARVTRPSEDGPEWECLLPADMVQDAVDARAVRALLDHVAPTTRAPDDTIDVQQHLRAWADDAGGRPYLVIFGEYGMGKTTACQVFTRELLDRRRRRDPAARLPIYLDLRNLGDVKLREPTLEQILEDLLVRAWQSGRADRPTAQEVIDHVRRRRAVIVFDGLDEVLVHLSERQGQALLRQLWSILPPRLHGDPQAGRALMTCRTHFFRTLREQHTYFRGEDREAVGADSYAAIHLLPFSEKQVRAYFEGRALAEADEHGVDRAIELIRAVHNLSDLVTRPYNLRLVADQLGALERRIASGERVDAAALYDELVARWLERDEGKHQLRKDDKLRLMEELAAELWRAGRRSLPVDRLETWLHARLAAGDELGQWFALARPDVAVLAEDLRTATFVVRPGADEFAFAHTSLQEYFLARRLARALSERDAAAWALPAPGEETLDFLGELIAGRDTEGCLRGLRALRASYRPQASELALAYCLRAAGRGTPAIVPAGFALDRARLRGVRIVGPADGPRLSLAGCTFAGADLRDARFERVRLEGCDLRGADLTRAELHDCVLERVALGGADLTATIVRDCRSSGLDLRDARAHRTQWLRSDTGRTLWPSDAEAHLVAQPRGPGATPFARPEAATARLATFAGHGGRVWGVAFSPDGSRLASAGDDAVLRVWDAAGGEQLLSLAGDGGTVRGVAFSPDGSRLASAGDDGVLRVWDAAGDEQLLSLAGDGGGVWGVAFSPDGSRLASAGSDGVRVWDVAGGEPLLSLAGDGGMVWGVAFSPDGSRLAGAGDDAVLRVWDAAGGEQLLSLAGDGGTVRGVAFSPDGSRLASAGDDGVTVWDAAGGEQLLSLAGHGGMVWGVAFSPDGSRLAGAGDDAVLRVWDAAGGEQLLSLAGHGGTVRGVAFSPDGSRLASAGDDGVLRVWDAAGGEQLLSLAGHGGRVRGVAFSPDGSRLASAGDDAVLRVWDAAGGERLLSLAGHGGRVWGVAFSPDGSRLASAGFDGVRVWDAAGGEQLLSLAGHGGGVRGVAFSPDGSRLAGAGFDGVLRVWDAVGGERLLSLAGHGGGVWGVAFSPDGSRLASAGFDGVRVWDAAGGEQLLSLAGHGGGVRGVAFSPDGSRLASAGFDGVLVWDAAGGEQLLSLAGHGGRVRGVAFSPDGSRLASAGDDGILRVWDAAGGEQLLSLAGHGGRVWGVAFSPDRSRLASAGDDGILRVWDAAGGEQLLAVHGLSDGEHAAFAAGRLISCTPGAWRWLGWLAPSPVTGALTRFPAETFGPLPFTS